MASRPSASGRSVRDRVERLCGAGLTPKALREQALAALRPALEYDAHVWLLTDPVTRVGTSPLADAPMMPWSRLPELGRLRYLTQVLRWADLMDAGRSSGLLLEETDGEPERSRLWAEVLRELGVVDVASLALWDRFGCWAWLDLWRCGEAAAYGREERELLEDLAAPLTRGIREAQARTFVDESADLAMTGPAVVVLGPDLQVRTQTDWAAEALHRLNPPDQEIPTIPAAAYHVGGALVAQEHGIPVGPPWSRVHLGAGRWVTLRAARMGAAPDGDIAVTIEPSTPAERREVFGLAHGLTPREREILDLLATGADAPKIAEGLFLSLHTVHDHVKAILAKTGTSHRQTLLARIVGA
ncbi:MAG TPA: helix-turn-helix transcriptional regulator [Nocardioides sp.]|nr:helix-turn-helix transcriptional regulator [Nocardioides sp.]